jgi:hypothetical protein
MGNYTRLRENFKTRNFIFSYFVLFTQYYWNRQMNENWMSGACSKHEKCEK